MVVFFPSRYSKYYIKHQQYWILTLVDQAKSMVKAVFYLSPFITLFICVVNLDDNMYLLRSEFELVWVKYREAHGKRSGYKL